jgi:hypothetical protein
VTFESLKSPVANLRATSPDTRGYRCYFTGVDDRIQSYEPIECADDAEAALKAQALLTASQFASAELWQGKRIVGKWSNIVAPIANGVENADRSA